MEMEGGIDPDVPLDHVELQIFPSKNRYEAIICNNKRSEKVASGALEQLLLLSPQVKDLSSKGSNTNLKILPPDNVNWFTTTTLTRFLYVLGSPDIFSIGNEITQLEETRKFQLSLSVKAEVDITSSIDSKNELLRAVDLRITALKDELVAAFDQVIGQRCSTKDISDLENFAHHFRAKDIRNSLQKFVEMGLFPTVEDSKSDQLIKDSQIDDDNSCFSSEEKDQPTVDRCRAPTRSSTPKRSSSPMRRVKIGRSGSHRATALTIKSLNYFPVREKVLFSKNPAGKSSDDEDEENPEKKNVLRMSVQDKISLFESKQRDQKVDVIKTKKVLNTNFGRDKAVLRRWSSGMGENSTKISDVNTDNSQTVANNEPPETESDSFVIDNQVSVETETVENIKTEEICEKHPASIEWSQQKEAELNDLFIKMMENTNKPVRITKSNKSLVLKEKKGGSFDEKVKMEASGKKKTKIVLTDVNNKPQKSNPLTNSKKEDLKPSFSKKNTSNLPATRKSWPSTPSPKPQSASSTVRLTNKSSEKTESQYKTSKSKSKSTQPEVNSILKTTNEKKQLTTLSKTTKPNKPKVDTPEAKKPSFYNKVTKKGSVVPLETKPFLRKGSGIKKKAVGQLLEASRSSGTPIPAQENDIATTTTSDMGQNQELFEPEVVSPIKYEESVSLNEFNINSDENKNVNEEELMISPNAWVEREDGDIISPCKESQSPVVCPVKVGVPRVRHSLSEMLLEESSEEAETGEWGNAENPPALIYQKESPKGLKRLLKFARKNKHDLHSVSWSSPSAVSEGDDDTTQESKGIGRFASHNYDKEPEGHVKTTTKATRSFFSLSAFRGSKTNETNFLNTKGR